MEHIKLYLESSSIHGLSYISTTRNLVKLFWISIVIGGFTGAGILINQSFQSWADNPVSTTIETLPIEEFHFPKITVCPPKNTFTDLNYDLQKTANMTLENDIRNELTNYAAQRLFDQMHQNILNNLSLIADNDRFYNWYHGYSKIVIPFNGPVEKPKPSHIKPDLPEPERFDIYYEVYTYAPSGSISTKHFGERFNIEKVIPTNIQYKINILSPLTIRRSENISLLMEIETSHMNDLLTGLESFTFVEEVPAINSWGYSDGGITSETENIIGNSGSFVKNFTPPLKSSVKRRYVEVNRKVTMQDMKLLRGEKMPGFKISWRHSGINGKVKMRTKKGLASDFASTEKSYVGLNVMNVDGVPKELNLYKQKAFSR